MNTADDNNSVLSPQSSVLAALAQRWVSYAVGVALGRFAPGVAGALGRGVWGPETAAALAGLRDADGLLVLDPGHRDDLGARVGQVLGVLVGAEEAERLIAGVTGGRTLGEYLARDFFKAHVQQYRKRPIYWLLQSPKRLYSLYVFHERVTADTLHLIRGTRYLGGKLNGVRLRLEELAPAIAAAPPGPARKRLERESDAATALLADLEAFDRALAAVTTQVNERGEIAGWRPERDDGVLINLAPLWPLLPAWAAEPRKAWEALARGDWDWAFTARRYWPDRVAAACRRNKSYALAHGLTSAEV
jgi:hypothetical protein